jgi:hypothetical protein
MRLGSVSPPIPASVGVSEPSPIAHFGGETTFSWAIRSGRELGLGSDRRPRSEVVGTSSAASAGAPLPRRTSARTARPHVRPRG